MRLAELSDNQKTEYNRFVMENESGSFLQSWEWGEWQKNLGRQAHRFFLNSNNESITGSNIIASIQLIKMSLPFGKYYLYSPYGPVVNSRCNQPVGEAGNEYLRFLIQEISKKFSDCVFIRIEPKNYSIIKPSSRQAVKSSNIQPARTLVINLSKTEDQLLAEMHPKTRYNIRLAQKRGVRVEKDLVITPKYGLYFKEVIEQIMETQNRQGYKGHTEDYYKNMVDFFGLKKESSIKINIYKALFENSLLASGIMLDFGNTRTYLFGGSAQENKQVMAPYLLHFQAMADAKIHGLLNYDFWGIETASGKEPGFARFKSGFGGSVLEYLGAYDYTMRKIQYGFYKVFRKIISKYRSR